MFFLFAFVWKELVRPVGFEYSYDFRWKTTTKLTSDWWFWNTAPNIDSNGIYYTAWWSTSVFYSIGDLSKASKITITGLCTPSTWSTACWFFLAQDKSKSDWLYYDSYPSVQFILSNTVVYDNRSSFYYNDRSVTIIFDLQAKTYSCTWFTNISWQLTDAQINNIKWCNQLQALTWWSARVKTISIKVE